MQPSRISRNVGFKRHDVTAGLDMHPDIVGVHDPVEGEPFRGKTTIVLSGHIHRPTFEKSGRSIFLGSGTTGGVSFGEGTSDPHIPHGASVLYFSKKASAYIAETHWPP